MLLLPQPLSHHDSFGCRPEVHPPDLARQDCCQPDQTRLLATPKGAHGPGGASRIPACLMPHSAPLNWDSHLLVLCSFVLAPTALTADRISEPGLHTCPIRSRIRFPAVLTQSASRTDQAKNRRRKTRRKNKTNKTPCFLVTILLFPRPCLTIIPSCFFFSAVINLTVARGSSMSFSG